MIVFDYNRNEHLKLLSTKCFRTLLFFTGLNLALDVASVYSITHLDIISAEMNRFIHQLFIGSVIIMIFCNYLYVEILSNEQRRPSLKRLLLTVLPLLTALVMVVFGDLHYMVTEDVAYSYGPMAVVVYICGVSYLFMCLRLTLSRRNSLTKGHRGSIRIGLGIWVAVLCFQIMVPSVLLSGFGFVLLILSIYFSFENQKENYDALTACFNRNAFYRMVAEYMEKGVKPYMVSITCDNLEQINMIHGYDIGNQILKAAKEVLRIQFKSEVFHSKENTFTTFTLLKPEEEALEMMKDKIEQLETKGIAIHYHITVIAFEQNVNKKDDAYELLNFVTENLEKSPSSIYYLQQDMTERKKRRDKIEQMVIHAMEQDGFEMFYQPIYDTKSKKFHSAEALIRLKDTTSVGFVSPEEFIPIVERKGMMQMLGNQIFDMVARDMRECDMEKAGIAYMEVNLSRVQAVMPNIAPILKTIIAKYELPHAMFNIEITETATIDSEELLFQNIEELRADGFSISMDDFGTGYSSLAQINQIHYELIKIDKSLIWPAFDKKEDESKRKAAEVLLSSTIKMIHMLHLKSVAEGVETEEMVEYLTTQGVDYLQGYYFSKPVNKEMFLHFLNFENKI